MLCSHKDLDLNVDTALFALPAFLENWKQPRCPPMAEWFSTPRFIHAMEYSMLWNIPCYSIKRKEHEMHVTSWVKLQGNILDEQKSQRPKYDSIYNTFLK